MCGVQYACHQQCHEKMSIKHKAKAGRALTAKLRKKTTHTHTQFQSFWSRWHSSRKIPAWQLQNENVSAGAQCTGVIEVDKIDVATCERHNNAMTAFISARRPLSKGARAGDSKENQVGTSSVSAPAIETNLLLLILIGLTSLRARPKTYISPRRHFAPPSASF